MVLYNSTGFQVLGIVCLDQLKGACHTQISIPTVLAIVDRVAPNRSNVIKPMSETLKFIKSRKNRRDLVEQLTEVVPLMSIRF